jgi:hypothetical protein
MDDIHKHEHTFANTQREIETQKQRARAAEDALTHAQIQLQRMQTEQERNTTALQKATKRHLHDENAVLALEKRVCGLASELDGAKAALVAAKEREAVLNQRIDRAEERDKHHLQVCVCMCMYVCVCMCACEGLLN